MMTAFTVSTPSRADQDAPTDAVGVRQNARLTAVTGFVLALLLGAQGLTLLGVERFIGPHILIGTALVAPVALKLGSTGWKIVRYYGHAPDYVRAGPPPIVPRLLAPVLIVTTVGLLGTGVALMLMGPRNVGPMFFLHKAFFFLWLAAIALHVLIHTMHSLRAVAAEATSPATVLPGRAWRVLTLAGVLGVGIGLALWSAQYVAPWATALRH